jgi:hypothetical protein
VIQLLDYWNVDDDDDDYDDHVDGVELNVTEPRPPAGLFFIPG